MEFEFEAEAREDNEGRLYTGCCGVHFYCDNYDFEIEKGERYYVEMSVTRIKNKEERELDSKEEETQRAKERQKIREAHEKQSELSGLHNKRGGELDAINVLETCYPPKTGLERARLRRAFDISGINVEDNTNPVDAAIVRLTNSPTQRRIEELTL